MMGCSGSFFSPRKPTLHSSSSLYDSIGTQVKTWQTCQLWSCQVLGSLIVILVTFLYIFCEPTVDGISWNVRISTIPTLHLQNKQQQKKMFKRMQLALFPCSLFLIVLPDTFLAIMQI